MYILSVMYILFKYMMHKYFKSTTNSIIIFFLHYGLEKTALLSWKYCNSKSIIGIWIIIYFHFEVKYVSDMFLTGFMRFIQNLLSALMSITLHFLKASLKILWFGDHNYHMQILILISDVY